MVFLLDMCIFCGPTGHRHRLMGSTNHRMTRECTLLRPLLLVLWLWCFLGSSWNGAMAFNLDVEKPLLYQGPFGSMFGFSVAQHKDRDTSWLIVGAPEAQPYYQNANRSGAIYRCTTALPQPNNPCRQIEVDRSGPKYSPYRGEQIQTEEKDHQWFGATVSSSGVGGVIAACAPRYVYFSVINFQRRDPVGACWVSPSSFSNFQEYSPCRTTLWGHHKQGYCQAGFSAALTKDGNRLYMGAVGSWYWQGQVFSQDLQNYKSLYETHQGPANEDNSYLGYSSAVGNFSASSSWDVAVGRPRGNTLKGQVLLYDETLRNFKNITGEQMGSYFGYAICVGDINGDGRDDIIIGAPMYSDFDVKDGSYERGRVYVVYQDEEHNFDLKDHLDGKRSRGRFGLALTSLGDINLDGFGDFAVGAPYDGENEFGVVYIYHGTPNGVFIEPTQVITAESVSERDALSRRFLLTTFGFSLSGGLDLDNNGYPDLLIGAYDSNRAVYLRSRPVANVTGSIRISREGVSLDEECTRKTLPNAPRVHCFVVSVCFEYRGTGVPNMIDVSYEVMFDVAKPDKPRAYFVETVGNTEKTRNLEKANSRLQKDTSACPTTKEVYLRSDIRDKLTPITVQLSYELLDVTLTDGTYLKPVLNQAIPNVLTKQVTILKECGSDNICIPDLHLEVTSNMEKYAIGSHEPLELNVTIENRGEDAYEAMMYLSKPGDLNDIRGFPGFCGEEKSGNGVIEQVCQLGNPMLANDTIKFQVRFKFESTSSSSLEFTFVVNSTNAENSSSLADNQVVITVPVVGKANLALRGKSEPEIVLFNRSNPIVAEKAKESDIGPEVLHVYQLINRGPSKIEAASVDILWPSYTRDGNKLLYLVQAPIVKASDTTKASCSLDVQYLNTERLEIEPSELLSSEMKDMGHERVKRDHVIRLPPEKEQDDDDDDPSWKEPTCDENICTRILCKVSELGNRDQVVFYIRSRLWNETLMKILTSDETHNISSVMVVRVKELTYKFEGKIGPEILSVTTQVTPEGGYRPFHIPWWVIFLAVLGGLLLLALLALLLWKLGFFKRKRPPTSEHENEPLNGYRMNKGDEML